MRRIAFLFALVVVVAVATSCTDSGGSGGGGGSPTSPSLPPQVSPPTAPTPLPTTIPFPEGRQRIMYVDGSGPSPLSVEMKDFNLGSGTLRIGEFTYCMDPVRPTGNPDKDYYVNYLSVTVVASPDGVNQGKTDGLIGGTLTNPYPNDSAPGSCITVSNGSSWFVLSNPSDYNYLVVLGAGGRSRPRLGQPVPGQPGMAPPLASRQFQIRD